MSASSSPRTTPKPRRRRLRFSLRTLLIVMLLLGVVFGVLGWMAQEARRQRKVVADLREMGAVVWFKEDFHGVFSDDRAWLPELLDTGYCGRVIFVGVEGEHFNDVSHLAEFANLQSLGLWNTRITDVSPLANFESLTILSLSGRHITDVSPLAAMDQLKEVELVDMQVTDEQVNELQQALPDCKIIR